MKYLQLCELKTVCAPMYTYICAYVIFMCVCDFMCLRVVGGGLKLKELVRIRISKPVP